MTIRNKSIIIFNNSSDYKVHENKRRYTFKIYECVAVFFYLFMLGGGRVERVEHTENTIEVFENDIDLYLHQFQDEQEIEDLRTVPQSVWNACLMYIQRHVFNNKTILKAPNIYNSNGIMDSNYNMYNYELLYNILEYYIYLCNMYNKEISSMGYIKLIGISNEIISMWGNDNNKLSSKSFEIYKKLNQEREESLSNKLADGKQNPVGVLAILNRHYQWNLPGVSKEQANKGSLTAAELPKLNGGKVIEITQGSP